MSQELYSVEQVAALLDLHVKTVRGYVREGRLKAVKIGKQYRIGRADLEALTGKSAPSRDPVARQRQVEVSSVLEISAVDPTTASRITNLLLGATNGRRAEAASLRVDTIYDGQRGCLKVILIGSIESTASLMKAVSAVLGY